MSNGLGFGGRSIWSFVEFNSECSRMCGDMQLCFISSFNRIDYYYYLFVLVHFDGDSRIYNSAPGHKGAIKTVSSAGNRSP